MKLWKKAAGLIKDRNSIWVASISRRTSFRNPDLEAIIIKATSHDEAYVDYKNFHRVYQWVRTSPLYLKPLLWAISTRMEKTRSWVVALKGLMLMHGIFCCKIPAVQMIGRLPFDLSNFCDRHSKPTKTWAYDAFVRAYFTYLDQRSAFLNTLAKKNRAEEDEVAMLDELGRLQKWQSLLDMLLEIKPETSPSHFLKNNITRHGKNNKVYLISEAMICLLTEIFDVYSRVCKGIAKSLVRIYASPGKTEAQLALGMVQTAANQGQDLSVYLEFCKDLGILSEADCPTVEQIGEEDIRDLERIINEATTRKENEAGDNKAIVVRDGHQQPQQQHQHKKTNSKTIITDKWEVFEDDTSSWVSADTSGFSDVGSTFTTASSAVTAPPSYYRNPFLAPSSNMSMVPYVPPAAHNQVLPDLISF